MKSLLESNPRPLRDLIRWCQDKIYALLGIASDGDDIVDIFDLFTGSLGGKPTEAWVLQLLKCLQLPLE